MSSEMSQTNQAENNPVNVIEIHSEEEEEDTPQNKKTKMIKKAPKKWSDSSLIFKKYLYKFKTSQRLTKTKANQLSCF